MRAALRENAACAIAASGCCLVLAWLGLYGFAWNDYELEAQPAVQALLQGHLAEFLRLAPAYGGSLIERAPFALLPGLWHGGELAVYRTLALPCLLASALLAVWLVARMRALGAPRLARAVTVGVCAANPVALVALELGHPEEVLAGCLCVAAVLLAGSPHSGRGRAIWAGIVLGLAIANKESAVLAAGPLLALTPPPRRVLTAVCAAASAGLVLAPLLLVPGGGFVAVTRSIASTSTASASTASAIFQPWQLWWFFGHHGAAVHGVFGSPKPGYRTGPAWASMIAHPLILGVGAALGLWLLLRTRRRERRGAGRLELEHALLALAIVLALRCLLDTWDTAYYPLPFLLALLAWEVTRWPLRPPVLALLASALTWGSFRWLPAHVSADATAALFLAWLIALTAWLAARLLRADGSLGSGGAPRELAGYHARAGGAQEITVRALGRPVSTS